jgi:hypothetical protein
MCVAEAIIMLWASLPVLAQGAATCQCLIQVRWCLYFEAHVWLGCLLLLIPCGNTNVLVCVVWRLWPVVHGEVCIALQLRGIDVKNVADMS